MNPATFMLQAVRNRVKTHVLPQISSTGSPKVASCELSDTGQPKPEEGAIYFAVHSGRRRNVSTKPGHYYLDEYYDFKLTVSIKSAHIIRHRFGDFVISSAEEGLNLLVDLAINSLHGYLSLVEEANELLLASQPDHQPFLFGEPPIFKDTSDPIPRSSSWWSAKLSDISGTPMGLSMELRFQGLRMIRSIGQL